MNRKTLTALKESIAHWERLATGKASSGEGVGVHHCALCQLFYYKGCSGCPVKKETGDPQCIGSPYMKAYHASYTPAGNQSYNNKKFKAAAAKELEFLKSLLPT